MHKVQTGVQSIEFQNITSITNISQIQKEDYVFLVQNEDTIDIWTSSNKVRGSNELVHYYEAWDGKFEKLYSENFSKSIIYALILHNGKKI